MLYQICGDNEDGSVDEDYYVGEDEYDSSYDYTNSKYLKSDDQNSMVAGSYIQNRSLLDDESQGRRRRLARQRTNKDDDKYERVRTGAINIKPQRASKRVVE